MTPTPSGRLRTGVVGQVTCIEACPTGRLRLQKLQRLGAIHRSRDARVWRICDAVEVAKLPIDGGKGVSFNPDGKRLMTAPCRLWALGTWREARQTGGQGYCFSTDGRLVAVKDANKVLRLVETVTGSTLARLESPDLCNVGSATFSPDGRTWLSPTTRARPCTSGT